MNILKFIESFTDDNFLNSKGSRRDSFTQFKTLGANAAIAAVPFGLASIALAPQRSNAASMAAAETPVQALQLALTLEYLEEEFYLTAMSTGGLIPAADRPIFQQILNHESDHVDFLQQNLGADSIAKPTFDFTGAKSASGGGPFSPFTNYDTFLALAQAFEDTGVRAYKGQAGNLMSKPDLLEAALQIHSVEAMHASRVRRLRASLGLANGQKGWIRENSRGTLPPQTQPVYDGEENVMQGGVNTSTISIDGFNSNLVSASESFDEPIDTATAKTIAGLFIVG
jgi:hypothetical protein